MTREQRLVLDASALLALLFREPGADLVRPVLRGAVMSTVNWTEVQQVILRRGGNVEGLRSDLGRRGLSFVSFDEDDADDAARLYPLTRGLQLSLADRACLALARRLSATVLTGDRVWADLDIGVEVRLIRGSDDS
jgi:PIN domain nuclease of toxin-antitoxin system